MRRFRLDVSQKTGITTLWMSSEESACGYIPIIGWENINGLREFADMLMDMYRYKTRENDLINRTSEGILEQVFADRELNKGDNFE